jgi:hypothetical protein
VLTGLVKHRVSDVAVWAQLGFCASMRSLPMDPVVPLTFMATFYESHINKHGVSNKAVYIKLVFLFLFSRIRSVSPEYLVVCS